MYRMNKMKLEKLNNGMTNKMKLGLPSICISIPAKQ